MADETKETTETKEQPRQAAVPVADGNPRHYLGRGKISTNREEVMKKEGGTLPLARAGTPAGQPVAQPSLPGRGVPSGLVDTRPVTASGRLGQGSLKDSLAGGREEEDDEDEDEEEESEYAGWSKKELEKEAAKRKLTVERLDGKDRDPRREDIIAALEEDDAASDEDEDEDDSDDSDDSDEDSDEEEEEEDEGQ